jgi:large subunit ribosomal protein L1
MAFRGKKYDAALAKIDRKKKYSLDEALDMIKDIHYSKADGTVEIAVRLGVDPRKSDEMVRGAVVLPAGTGKNVRVLVFAKGEKEAEAKAAGADFVGSDDLVEKIKGGWLDFDKTIATPDMMKDVGKLGRILGTRGLMPNPKVGTVTFEVEKAVKELKAGRVEYRVDKAGNIHAGVGKVSFTKENLLINIANLLDALQKAKPAAAKGTYFRSFTIATTHSPGIKLDTNQISDVVRDAQLG